MRQFQKKRLLSEKAYCGTVCGNTECPLRLPDKLKAKSIKTGGLLKLKKYKDTEKCPGYVDI